MIRVKVSHVDDSLSSKGARTLEVRVSSSRSFSTPSRPFSAREYTAKNFLGYRGEVSSPLAAVPVDLRSGDSFDRFLRNNGFIADTRKGMQMFVDSSYTTPCFAILQTRPVATYDRAPIKIAFDMQKDIDGLDLMCMPEVLPGPGDYEGCVRDWCDSSEDVGKTGVPQLSLSDDIGVFKERLNVLCDLSHTGGVPLVNIRYAPGASLQLVALWERRNELESMINCSEVPSKGQRLQVEGMTSDIESDLIQHGFDSITRAKRHVSPKFIAWRNLADPPGSLKEIDGFRVSSHDASCNIDGPLWRDMRHPPECGCSVCRGDSREDIIERFAYKDNGDISPSGLRYYSILHDHQSDVAELDVMRRYIVTDGLSEYEDRVAERRSDIIGSI